MDDCFSTLLSGSELPPDRARELHQHGFIVLPSLVPAWHADHLAQAYDAAVASASADDVRTGRTTTRVAAFVNRGAEFDDVYVSAPLLEACSSIIGRPFKLSSLHARTLWPGHEAQELHADVRRDSADWPLQGAFIPRDGRASTDWATRMRPETRHASVQSRGTCSTFDGCPPSNSAGARVQFCGHDNRECGHVRSGVGRGVESPGHRARARPLSRGCRVHEPHGARGDEGPDSAWQGGAPQYWATALGRLTSLRFTVDRVVWDASSRELAIIYTAEIDGKSRRVSENLRFDEADRVVAAEVFHGIAW